MIFANAKAWDIPEGEVVKVESKGVVLWQKAPSIKNWARCSINADGSIYNNGQGYKEGYRIRSGGAEGTSTDAVCTGFIPLKKGETLYISPAFAGFNSSNTINFADSSFANLGQINDNGTAYGICSGNASLYKTTKVNGISTLTLTDEHDSNIAYVRITHNLLLMSSDASNMIITVNQEIS